MGSRQSVPALTATLGVGALGSAMILAITPLHDLTENGCGAVVHHPGAVFDCGTVVLHRTIETAIVAVVGIALLVVAHLQWKPPTALALVVAALAVCFIWAGVWSLSRGDGNGLDTGICGAVLSKDDPRGLYDAGKPASCRPVYDGRIDSARTDFIVAALALVGVGAVELRPVRFHAKHLQAAAR
jgi:hypothetical protein